MVRKNKRNTTRRRRRAGAGRQRLIQLPAPFNRVGNDIMRIHGKGLHNLTAGATDTKGSLFLSPKSGGTVDTLYNLMPSLNGIAAAYDKFIVENLVVRIVPGVSYLSGAVIAAGFQPQRDTEATNPTTYNAVINSAHNCLSTASNISQFSCRPMNYYGDWRIVNGDAYSSYNGYIRWYSGYFGAGAGAVIGYLDITFDIVFAGLKTDVGTV